MKSFMKPALVLLPALLSLASCVFPIERGNGGTGPQPYYEGDRGGGDRDHGDGRDHDRGREHCDHDGRCDQHHEH